ncbi:hypothetical protein PN36_22565 [Candidatus Thiomargarita nelsonii]|uniref:HAD family hydrolase n=1 Tax=Candidatus Thiomargarita nelsonii TaxID=1003181 RepID=A0A0A6P4E0_9GAMM|nr:hypothetical protein PN36_22565 [Candidatus Thiomargarita nelsonii]
MVALCEIIFLLSFFGETIMKVIFLDIDGVLQPGTQHRFDHDMDKLKEDLIQTNPDYETIDKHDIGATYYDWDKTAVSLLTELCEKTGAQFVISSGWRFFASLQELRLLFSIHQIDKYVFDTLGTESTERKRYEEIQDYLESHNNVTHYVIIGERYAHNFIEHFPLNIVYTDWVLTEKDCEKAAMILENR